LNFKFPASPGNEIMQAPAVCIDCRAMLHKKRLNIKQQKNKFTGNGRTTQKYSGATLRSMSIRSSPSAKFDFRMKPSDSAPVIKKPRVPICPRGFSVYA
jgi:hypothetical protein